MLNLPRTVAIFLTLLIISCAATTPSGKTFDSALGEWKTGFTTITGGYAYPQMTIIDETKATYGFHGGRINFHAVDDQGKWEGYWAEDYALNMSCTEKKDGSNVWGVVVFQFNDTYTSFTGDWDACGEGRKYSWNGNRS